MSKDLPYFKFIATQWLTGDIALETLEVQGLFINICALYWKKSGVLEISEIEKRFKKRTLISVLKNRYFSVGDNGRLSIKFLDDQLSEREGKGNTNSRNAKEGWKKRRDAIALQKNADACEVNADQCNIEEEKDIEKEEDISPTPFLVTALVIDNYFKFRKGLMTVYAGKHKDTYENIEKIIRAFMVEKKEQEYQFQDTNHFNNSVGVHLEKYYKDTPKPQEKAEIKPYVAPY